MERAERLPMVDARSVVTPLATLLFVAAALLAVRLVAVWQFSALGADAGAYLFTRNWVLGDDLTTHGMTRPPLVGVLLVPLTWALGDYAGSQVIAAAATVALGLAVYPLARRFVSPWLAVLAALAVMAHPYYGASIGRGAYLPMLALAASLVGLRLFVDHLDGKRALWPFVAVTFAVAGLNQTVAVLNGVVLLSVALALGPRRGVTALALAALVSLPWLPFYLARAPFVSGYHVTGAPLLVWQPNALAVLTGVVAFFAAALAPDRRRALLLLAFAAPVVALPNFVSGDDPIVNLLQRGRIVLPVVAALSGALLADAALRVQWARDTARWLAVPGVLAVGLVLLASHDAWEREVGKGAEYAVTRDGQAAIAWAAENTAPEDTLLVHTPALSWWLMGAANRHALWTWHGGAVAAHEGEPRATRCAFGWLEGCDPHALRDEYGVDWLVVDTSNREKFHAQPADAWARLDNAPWLEPVTQFGDVRVYRYAGD